MINEKCKKLSNDDLDFVLKTISILKNEFVKNSKPGK